MKFSCSQVFGSFRRGQLQLEQCLIQTPGLILYTRGASIPHITREVLEMITKDHHILQIPLLSTIHMKNTLESSKNNNKINDLSGLSEYPVFFTFQDHTIETPVTQLEKYTMPLWARIGKKAIDAEEYMTFIETFKPSMYVTLYDGCTNSDSAKKRIFKSVARSEVMFQECLKRHKISDYLSKNSNILGAIVGGYSIEQRQNSLNTLLNSSEDICGFVMDGFDTSFPSLKNHTFENKKDIVNEITTQLPQDKLRIVPGCWNASTLMEFISSGWDLFDTSAVFQTTENNAAFVFDFNIDGEIRNGHANDSEFIESQYEIDLEDKRYKECFTPIVDGCECLTCRKHTRAYINHLINTKELLAGVLLSIHNLHHYLKFFNAIRECKTEVQFNKLKRLIDEQYKQHCEVSLSKPKIKVLSPKTKRKRLSPDRTSQ